MSSESTTDGPILGIVFDAVGTLVEPEPSVAVAYVEAARRQGISMDPDVVRERFYRHFGDDEVHEQRGPLATDEGTEHRRWYRIVRRVLPELADPDRAFAELWDHFARPESWRVFADVAPALSRLEQAGIRVAIGSNFDSRLRGVAAGLPELCGLLDAVVVSSEVGYRKPHPAFYTAAARALDAPPDRVMFVGDDPANDVEGPRRAGMRALLLDRRGRFADRGLPRIRDLAALLDLGD